MLGFKALVAYLAVFSGQSELGVNNNGYPTITGQDCPGNPSWQAEKSTGNSILSTNGQPSSCFPYFGNCVCLPDGTLALGYPEGDHEFLAFKDGTARVVGDAGVLSDCKDPFAFGANFPGATVIGVACLKDIEYLQRLKLERTGNINKVRKELNKLIKKVQKDRGVGPKKGRRIARRTQKAVTVRQTNQTKSWWQAW